MTDDAEAPRGEVPRGADVRTFLFADIRGYTRFTQEHGDEAASELAGRFADLVRQTVPEFEGELLELRGDEALSVFRSARQALRAAVELQRRMRTAVDDKAALPLGVGMGLDAGEAVPTQGGYRGASLNLAARLCAIAKPGQILATEGVAHLANRIDGLRLEAGRSLRLKGVDRPVRAIEVVPESPLPPVPSPPSAGRSRRILIVAGIALAALIVVVAAAITRSQGGSHAPPAANAAVHADSLVVLDARSGKLVRDVPLHTDLGAVAAGQDAVWVASDADQTVTRVGPSYAVGTPIGVGIDPAEMIVAFGTVWVYDAVDNEIKTVDPTGRTQPSSVPALPACPTGISAGCGAGGMARDASGIWLGRSCSRECAPPHYGTAWHIDPVTFRRGERFTHIPSDRLAFGDGTLWAYGGEGFHVSRVDQSRVVTYDVPDVSAVYNRPGITTAFGAAWAAGPSGQVFKYTVDGGYIRSIQVPPGAYEIAAGGDSLWVIASGGDVTRINPFTLVAKPVQHLGHNAEGIAYLDGRIWIAVGNVAGQG